MSIATLLSQHHKVYAVDIVPEKVDLINQRKSPIQDEYIEKIRQWDGQIRRFIYADAEERKKKIKNQFRLLIKRR